ncbi:DHHA1 domain-containing protein, partial [Thermodesulfobacteriota bacterium]
GGGRPDMAQGGGNNPQKLTQALESVKDIIS